VKKIDGTGGGVAMEKGGGNATEGTRFPELLAVMKTTEGQRYEGKLQLLKGKRLRLGGEKRLIPPRNDDLKKHRKRTGGGVNDIKCSGAARENEKKGRNKESGLHYLWGYHQKTRARREICYSVIIINEGG